MMRQKNLGIIFSNVHDDMLGMLTQNRCTGSIPYGGRYRLIDFALSNMVNCNVGEVGIITKSNYQSLMDHVGNGKEWDLARKIGGLRILPPFNNQNSSIYRGRIDALLAAMGFIQRSTAQYVIIADSDVIANIDYNEMIAEHKDSGADITLAYVKEKAPCDFAEKAVTFGIEGKRIVDMQINDICTTVHNRYLDIAIMERNLLVKMVGQLSSRNFYSFSRDFLLANVNKMIINAYEFTGYYAKVSSLKKYYAANMELLAQDVRDELFTKKRPIYTKVRDEVPVVYGLEASVSNSIFADGCTINGTVENSIIFRGVTVEKGAKVKNSIIMQGTKIGRGASIDNIISDKNVMITDHRILTGSESYPILISKGSII